MKLKKLIAVVVVVIAIGLSVFGCNPLPDSSSLNSSSNSSSEKVNLPVANEELRELRGYVSTHTIFYHEFVGDNGSIFFQTYFKNEFEKNELYFYFVNITELETELFNRFYFDYAIEQKNVNELCRFSGVIDGSFGDPIIEDSSIPATYYDYFFDLYSFGYETYQSEFSYVLTEIKGYQYNKLITVFAGEEVVAKFYYYTTYNHIEDEYFLNLLKNYSFQTQVNNDVIISE